MVCPVEIPFMEKINKKLKLELKSVMEKHSKETLHIEHKNTCNPVDSNALHSADAGGNNVFPPCLVPLGPGYTV